MTRDEIKQLIAERARAYGIDPAWAIAQLTAESNLNPNAVGPQTRYGQAKGLAQFLDSTWAQYGQGSPFDPVQAVEAYMRYMSDLLRRYGGDYIRATAAYNAGPGNVDRYGGVPPFPETRNYIARIQRLARGIPSGVPSNTPSGVPSNTPSGAPIDVRTAIGLAALVGILAFLVLR